MLGEARYLFEQALGLSVSLLVLFDTYNYSGVPLTRSFGQRATYLGQKARFHWQNIWGLTPGDRRIYLREKIREVRTREWERLSVGLRNLLRKRFGRQTESQVFLENINDKAGFAYQPQHS